MLKRGPQLKQQMAVNLDIHLERKIWCCHRIKDDNIYVEVIFCGGAQIEKLPQRR